MNPWVISEENFNIDHNTAYEGLLTLGNGYLHSRGSFEEHLSQAPQNEPFTLITSNHSSQEFPKNKSKWGTYIPGVWGNHPLLNKEIVNLPFFWEIIPIVDGEQLDMELSNIKNYHRELNLKTATLTRNLQWHTKAGATIDLTFERFISAARPNLCCQRFTLESHQKADMEIISGINSGVLTNGYNHFKSVQFTHLQNNRIRCEIKTDDRDEVRIIADLLAINKNWTYVESPDRCFLQQSFTIAPGKKFVFEKRTFIAATNDLNTHESLMDSYNTLSYEYLHAEHAVVWQKRWDASDVVIEGDDMSQLAIRTSIYHLIRVHADNNKQVSIDAKGYSGDAYWGRYFWDTEIYMLPFYIYTNPASARTLLEFRIQSLAGACKNAARLGYPGARYPWESDSEGNECCTNWQYADHQVHITADIIFAMIHYLRATNNKEFIAAAAQTILETARYWVQRIDKRQFENHYSLLGVMGPDEYTPISNNNSYTNRLVAFALEAASKYGRLGGATNSECDLFAHISKNLPISRDENNFVLQCEEFEKYADPKFEYFWKNRSKHFAMHVSQERLYRSKCLKQADVIMLMMLFPNEFTKDEIVKAWDYYLPLTTHDSSLSFGIHAIVASMIGQNKNAWDFWLKSSLIDFNFANGAQEGVHMASHGLNWQIIIFGFAGMQSAVNADVLTFKPNLPAKIHRLAFPLIWKGKQIHVEISKDELVIKNNSCDIVTVAVDSQQSVIPSGEAFAFVLGECYVN